MAEEQHLEEFGGKSIGMKKVFISEDRLRLLKESTDEVTFYKFFTEVKNFIKELLVDPINASPSDFLRTHGLSRSRLINKMLERGIVKKTENIDEPMDANFNKISMHYVQYSVPKQNFERKIRRLHSYFFERGERKKVSDNDTNNNEFSY